MGGYSGTFVFASQTLKEVGRGREEKEACTRVPQSSFENVPPLLSDPKHPTRSYLLKLSLLFLVVPSWELTLRQTQAI